MLDKNTGLWGRGVGHGLTGADVRGDCTGEAAAGSNLKNGRKLFRRPKFSILIILAAVPLHWKLAAAISLSFNKQQLDEL